MSRKGLIKEQIIAVTVARARIVGRESEAHSAIPNSIARGGMRFAFPPSEEEFY